MLLPTSLIAAIVAIIPLFPAFVEDPPDVAPAAEVAATQQADKAEITFYDEVSSESATLFLLQLSEASGAKHITIHINTPGGSVDAMQLMASAIEEVGKKSEVTCVVEGMAASAGLYIFESCPIRVMTADSILMAHEAAMSVTGHFNAHELRNLAGRLDALNQIYAAHCSARMKMTTAEFRRKVLAEEWWFGADEALSIGAIDRILPASNAG